MTPSEPSLGVHGLRIVSLVPSLTETLFDLGFGPWLVGRTGFCIHPASRVLGVPKVGGTKNIHLQKIARLRPTHVLVNVDENTLMAVNALRDQVPQTQIVVTHPCSAHDNLALIDQLLAALLPSLVAINSIAIGAINARAADLKNQIQQALAALAPASWPSERVLYLVWKDPWMTVARDTYISRMLALRQWHTWPDVQGGAQGAARYPQLSGQEPWLGQVQRVLLSSEPYRFSAQHRAAAQALCPQAQVQLVDGERLSWYGSRSLAGLNYLQHLDKDSI